MKRKKRKRCPFCGELFWPDNRSRGRQWACGAASCQTLRRRETQRRYRLRNVGDGEARRYRSVVSSAKGGSGQALKLPFRGSIFRSLVWSEMKDEISPEVFVTLGFIAKLVMTEMRDERMRQVHEITEEIARLQKKTREDEIESMARRH